MEDFINKVKGTKITAIELFTTFKGLQLITPEDLIAFWQTIQFTVELEEKNLNDNDKEIIAGIEKVIVENMVNISKNNLSLREQVIKIVSERDRKRDDFGFSKIFGGTNYVTALANLFN